MARLDLELTVMAVLTASLLPMTTVASAVRRVLPTLVLLISPSLAHLLSILRLLVLLLVPLPVLLPTVVLFSFSPNITDKRRDFPLRVVFRLSSLLVVLPLI